MMRGLGPGSIIVNRAGERFADGALTYNDFPKTFGNFDPTLPGYPNLPPAWVVFGQKLKQEKAILSVAPSEDAPDWIARADTIEELAAIIGVDPAGLAASVEARTTPPTRPGTAVRQGPFSLALLRRSAVARDARHEWWVSDQRARSGPRCAGRADPRAVCRGQHGRIGSQRGLPRRRHAHRGGHDLWFSGREHLTQGAGLPVEIASPVGVSA